MQGKGENTLLVTRHEPAITMGKSAREKDLLVDKETLARRGVDYVEIDRGGGITYHGPGQVVLYPIFDLREYGKDLREFIARLGEVTRRAASSFGVDAEFRSDDKIGLWISKERKKLCSIGLRVKRWVTMHGVAFNADIDREKSSLIRPCGIRGTQLVSITDYTDVSFEEVKNLLLEEFEKEFAA
ncbi:lipoyl(octanoyl) transferase LipB [Candidatus Bipolaricaulota bacterium]|nr:lipoyl(octanoyl) transferase LipB [Candidatus Bipolaricaulota bacterium]